MHLRLAIDYSAREEIVRATARAIGGPVTLELFEALLGPSGPVDLLIRTGGEQRLSDFLLWECAYAELAFLDVMWPDFTPACLAAALADFRRRERRFGGIAGTPASAIFANC